MLMLSVIGDGTPASIKRIEEFILAAYGAPASSHHCVAELPQPTPLLLFHCQTRDDRLFVFRRIFRL